MENLSKYRGKLPLKFVVSAVNQIAEQDLLAIAFALENSIHLSALV
ncbi:hypothetical protein RF679_01385 [Undibacterium cyanobacteriorum]|uniref:Uncharacterized protein n=1 Tax=Undibacterium cyanobacteriorum TaxID=3073561 RepID=A0ABY9RJV7_9BURK|nr:hypothetical protein [Undibacterium sp. 20NA77.5]WMW80949.1 hypothetical protein RF679_01385 [Undibacterium sp. 20NA77.5]